jgi:putative peptidoglycan lipid II flippase
VSPVTQRHRYRQLIVSTLMVLGLSLLAKCFGAFKEVVLANRFGTGALMDQFVFAFTVAILPASLLASILTLALTPVLSQIGAKGAADGQRFLSQLWGACLMLSVAVGAILWWLFPMLSPVASSGGPQLAAVVAVVAFVSCLSALATAVLVCHRQQVGSLLEGVPSLVLGVVMLASVGAADMTLFAALVFGMVLQLLTLWWAYARTAGPVRASLPQFNSALWRQLSTGLGFVAAGYALLVLAMAIELNIASHLPSGSVASLGYAARITALVTGLLLTAVNRVAIVHFCDATIRHATHWQACASVLVAFTAAGVVGSALMIYFAPDIVAVFYERGRFDAQASQTVSHLMRWHISQLAPSLAAAVLSAYFSATNGFRTIFFACLVCFVGEVAFAYFGAAIWGLDAVAAAPMVGRSLMFVVLLLAVLSRRTPVVANSTITPAFVA